MTRLCFAAALALAILGFAPVAGATVLNFHCNLDGLSESPPNASPGTGFATVQYDDVAHTMHLHVDFTGLTGTTTASHIHAATLSPGTGTAGVATTTPSFAGFPLGVTSGTFDNTLDLTLASSWNPSYVGAHGGTTAGAEAALAQALVLTEAYWNIHSQTFPGGEIRGFLVPEPCTIGLVGFGLLMLRRRR